MKVIQKNFENPKMIWHLIAVPEAVRSFYIERKLRKLYSFKQKIKMSNALVIQLYTTSLRAIYWQSGKHVLSAN